MRGFVALMTNFNGLVMNTNFKILTKLLTLFYTLVKYVIYFTNVLTNIVFLCVGNLQRFFYKERRNS